MDDSLRRGIEQDCLRLIAAYAVTADQGDCEGFVATFAPDGRWVRPNGDAVEGHDALRAFFLQRPATTLSRHVTSNALVEVLGPDEARGVSCATVYRVEGHAGGVPAVPAPDSLVEYHDRFVRTAEGWRIALRRSGSVFRRPSAQPPAAASNASPGARVPLPARDAFPAAHLDAYDRMQRERGNPTPHVFLALANIPNLLSPLLDFTAEMRRGAVLGARYREMGIVMTALTAGSQYEFDHHWNHAIRAGVRREQLEAIADQESSPLFDERERAVLRYAAEVTRTVAVSDATWDALVAAFSLREAMDLVMAVAWYNAVARINGPLRIENEPWFERL